MKNKFFHYSILALASGILAACTENKGAERKSPPPIPVAITIVKADRASYFDIYPSVVVAMNQVEIRSEVSGYITGIYFKDGQHVQKGMKLYAVDQRQFKAAVDQASANLNVAKANLAKAQEDADRYRDLAKKDAVARQTLEHALADLRSAKMQVAASEANVKNVQTNLRYSTLTAPFDGTIGISAVKFGSSVAAGQTLLNTISSDDPIGVECAIDEKEINRFTELMQREPGKEDSTFTLVLPDRSVYPSSGSLSMIDRSVDPQTGTIRIRTMFPNPRNLLRAGLTVNLRVRTVTPPNTLLISAAAVVEQMGEYFVFVVQDGKVSQRSIGVGRIIGNKIVVSHGLSAGDQVVTEGLQRLKDNAPVVVIPDTPDPASKMARSN